MNIDQEIPIDQQEYNYIHFAQQTKVPSTSFDAKNQSLLLTSVLSQALKSSDKQLIDYALENTPTNLINESVLTLDLGLLQTLSDYVVDKLISYPFRTQSLLPWAKCIVIRGQGDFSKLYYAFEKRTQNYQSLQNLERKLNFLKANAPSNKQVKSLSIKKVFIEEINQMKQVDKPVEESKQLLDEIYAESEGNAIDQEYDEAYQMNQKQIRQEAQEEETVENLDIIKF